MSASRRCWTASSLGSASASSGPGWLNHRPGYQLQNDDLAFCFCTIFFRKPEATFQDDALAPEYRDTVALDDLEADSRPLQRGHGPLMAVGAPPAGILFEASDSGE